MRTAVILAVTASLSAVAAFHGVSAPQASLASAPRAVTAPAKTTAAALAKPVVAPRDADGKFSIAVLPDTQAETEWPSDRRFISRTQSIVAQKNSRDYRFALHTGDVVNWGWLVPSQYSVASQAMKQFENAGIPYSIAVGNHDTRAVGWNGVGTQYGGGAYAQNPQCIHRLGRAACDTKKLVRNTTEFNKVFTTSRYRNVKATWEPKKIENVYSTFSAAGKQWLVLSLELWPRTGAVNWARSVVSRHPHHNVIVITHSYLNANGTISTSNGGYGANSPKYLYDNLISQYSNIKMVFSGHTGTFASRVDVSRRGNRVVSYLQGMHAKAPAAPYRTVEIDVKSGTVRTSMVDATTNRAYPNSSPTYTGLKFV